MFVNIILVGFGGFLGAVARYMLSLYMLKTSELYSFGTLIANVTGSFLLGLILFNVIPERWFGTEMRLLLAVGFCGSFTTMSAFAYETARLISIKEIGIAAIFITANIFLSIAAIYLAKYIGSVNA